MGSMERASVSRSSQFVERWAKSEQMNVKLGITLMASVAVCISLTAALVYLALKPRPIYYIPGTLEAGVAVAQAMPEATVSVFVSSWVLNWSNFTPATVQDAYTRAQKFMSPHLLAQTQARLKKDIDEVKRNNISSFFSVTREPSVASEKMGFRVSLQGEKGIYMGKEEIKTQPMVYQVRVRLVNPTEHNPYGLMIDEIDQEVSAT